MMHTEPNISRRFTATCVDYVIYYSFFFWFISSFGTPNPDGGYGLHNDPLIFVLVLVWLLWFPLPESIWGQTLGKVIVKLKVVTKNGNPISFAQAFQRRLLDFLDFFFFGLVAIITVGNTPNHQRLGDLWAKTIVVRLDAIQCLYCQENLVLSKEEFAARKFTCPVCQKENLI